MKHLKEFQNMAIMNPLMFLQIGTIIKILKE